MGNKNLDTAEVSWHVAVHRNDWAHAFKWLKLG